ncbi:hypothetical protein Pcaca01_28730 [Pectobacterium carotovorum subsp. carotovorum]|nr:hypothetical protein Pcaca01_28730 [Pectobacterium carotovorum subsp. carotovorum]
MQDEAETSNAVRDRRDVLTPAYQFDQTVNILLLNFTHSHVLFIFLRRRRGREASTAREKHSLLMVVLP